MPIHVTCTCGREAQLAERLAGKRVKCPGCGRKIQVPIDGSGTIPAGSCEGLPGFMNRLTTSGTQRFIEFLNQSGPSTAEEFGGWVGRASPGELTGAADILNQATDVSDFLAWWRGHTTMHRHSMALANPKSRKLVLYAGALPVGIMFLIFLCILPMAGPGKDGPPDVLLLVLIFGGPASLINMFALIAALKSRERAHEAVDRWITSYLKGVFITGLALVLCVGLLFIGGLLGLGLKGLFGIK